MPELRIIFNLLFLDRLLRVFQKGMKALVRRFITMVHGIRSLVYITVDRSAPHRMNHHRIFRAVFHVGLYFISRKHLETCLPEQLRDGLCRSRTSRPSSTTYKADADNPNQND